jgi:hypothetical protein
MADKENLPCISAPVETVSIGDVVEENETRIFCPAEAGRYRKPPCWKKDIKRDCKRAEKIPPSTQSIGQTLLSGSALDF